MQAVACLAFPGDPGPDDLRQAVDVVGGAAEGALERRPHALGPRLGAIEPVTQAEGARVPPLLLQRLGDVQRERGRGAQAGGPQIVQQQEVARGVAGGDGDDAQADALGAVVKAETAGEEAVAVPVVQRVARAGAGGEQHARHHLAPHVEIAGRVADEGRLALGAGRRVDARQLGARDGEEPEGIVLAQVALARERQRGQLAELADRVAAQPLGVERHALGGPGERRAQPVLLERLARGARKALERRVPDHNRRGGRGNCTSMSR